MCRLYRREQIPWRHNWPKYLRAKLSYLQSFAGKPEPNHVEKLKMIRVEKHMIPLKS
jgi:hypothetical protein